MKKRYKSWQIENENPRKAKLPIVDKVNCVTANKGNSEMEKERKNIYSTP